MSVQLIKRVKILITERANVGITAISTATIFLVVWFSWHFRADNLVCLKPARSETWFFAVRAQYDIVFIFVVVVVIIIIIIVIIIVEQWSVRLVVFNSWPLLQLWNAFVKVHDQLCKVSAKQPTTLANVLTVLFEASAGLYVLEEELYFVEHFVANGAEVYVTVRFSNGLAIVNHENTQLLHSTLKAYPALTFFSIKHRFVAHAALMEHLRLGLLGGRRRRRQWLLLLLWWWWWWWQCSVPVVLFICIVVAIAVIPTIVVIFIYTAAATRPFRRLWFLRVSAVAFQVKFHITFCDSCATYLTHIGPGPTVLCMLVKLLPYNIYPTVLARNQLVRTLVCVKHLFVSKCDSAAFTFDLCVKFLDVVVQSGLFHHSIAFWTPWVNALAPEHMKTHLWPWDMLATVIAHITVTASIFHCICFFRKTVPLIFLHFWTLLLEAALNIAIVVIIIIIIVVVASATDINFLF